MIDTELLTNLVDYNIYKKTCFKNGIIPIFKDKVFDSVLSSRYQKVSRIKKRFVYLINRYKNLYFITFTFDDDHIKLCDRSRKDLIKSSLYSFDKNIKYILNIDYGKKNERLHYHCIVATNENGNLKDFLQNNYPCFTYTERIRFSADDVRRTTKYINKLSNHAIKDTTKKSRILYNFKGYDNLDKYLAKLVYFYDSQKIGLT